MGVQAGAIMETQRTLLRGTVTYTILSMKMKLNLAWVGRLHERERQGRTFVEP